MNALGRLKFLASGGPPPIFGPSVGGADSRSTLIGDYDSRDVEIVDARRAAARFTLDKQGFELRTLPEAGDLYDRETIADRHDPQCRQLVASATGAGHVHVFDHTWRSDAADKRDAHGSREPSAFVHNDYTPRSARWRVEAVMGAEAAELCSRPFAIVNVWRPISAIESSPIALCDARSLSADALVPAERRGNDRVGEIFLVRFDTRQRWFYFSAMQPNEVLLIKTFDTRDDGRARWCAHTAFEQSTPAPRASPRESIETRLFAFFGD